MIIRLIHILEAKPLSPALESFHWESTPDRSLKPPLQIRRDGPVQEKKATLAKVTTDWVVGPKIGRTSKIFLPGAEQMKQSIDRRKSTDSAPILFPAETLIKPSASILSACANRDRSSSSKDSSVKRLGPSASPNFFPTWARSALASTHIFSELWAMAPSWRLEKSAPQAVPAG